jgi:CRP/FNR family transcriptional regulator
MNKCAGCSVFKKCFASTLAEQELLEFEKEIKVLHLKKGDVVFLENKPANKIFALLSGTVKLEHNYNLSNPMIIRILHQCEFFGLESMLSNRNFLHSAVALGEGVCCSIPKAALGKFLLINKDFCSMLLNMMQDEQERLYKYSVTMISGSSQAKLALALCSIIDREEKLKATKEEIAIMTGLTRETVSHLLSKMNTEGIIETKQREIKILDKSELTKLIGT